MDQAFCCVRCISWWNALVFGNRRRIIQYPARPIMNCLLAPNRIEPIPDDLVVSLAKKLFSKITLAPQVSRHCIAKTMCGNLDFGDWLAQALTKVHSGSECMIPEPDLCVLQNGNNRRSFLVLSLTRADLPLPLEFAAPNCRKGPPPNPD
jgi:hypothetical protein